MQIDPITSRIIIIIVDQIRPKMQRANPNQHQYERSEMERPVQVAQGGSQNHWDERASQEGKAHRSDVNIHNLPLFYSQKSAHYYHNCFPISRTRGW
jgi:hypothetical protein